MSTTLRVLLTFEGSTVQPKELGRLTVPDGSSLTTIATGPFGGMKVSKQDVAMLLRTIADDMDPEES